MECNQSVAGDTGIAQCNFSNYPRGTEMKKAVMGITNALLAQNMGKSCDQMNFYRSRVQWLREAALEELFPRLHWSMRRC